MWQCRPPCRRRGPALRRMARSWRPPPSPLRSSCAQLLPCESVSVAVPPSRARLAANGPLVAAAALSSQRFACSVRSSSATLRNALAPPVRFVRQGMATPRLIAVLASRAQRPVLTPGFLWALEASTADAAARGFATCRCCRALPALSHTSGARNPLLPIGRRGER